jgi:hypothetical protein
MRWRWRRLRPTHDVDRNGPMGIVSIEVADTQASASATMNAASLTSVLEPRVTVA